MNMSTGVIENGENIKYKEMKALYFAVKTKSVHKKMRSS